MNCGCHYGVGVKPVLPSLLIVKYLPSTGCLDARPNAVTRPCRGNIRNGNGRVRDYTLDRSQSDNDFTCNGHNCYGNGSHLEKSREWLCQCLVIEIDQGSDAGRWVTVVNSFVCSLSDTTWSWSV